MTARVLDLSPRLVSRETRARHQAAALAMSEALKANGGDLAVYRRMIHHLKAATGGNRDEARPR